MAIELRDDAANGVNEGDGSSWHAHACGACRPLGTGQSPAAARRWRRSGEDRGEGGYRCRWTVMGGAARDGTWEYKETVRQKSRIKRRPVRELLIACIPYSTHSITLLQRAARAIVLPS